MPMSMESQPNKSPCPKPTHVVVVFDSIRLSYTLGRSSFSLLCYFEKKHMQINIKLFRENTMGSNWTNLKCSALYMYTGIQPKQNCHQQKTWDRQHYTSGLIELMGPPEDLV